MEKMDAKMEANLKNPVGGRRPRQRFFYNESFYFFTGLGNSIYHRCPDSYQDSLVLLTFIQL